MNEHNPKLLIDAIHERRERAVEVKATYTITEIGPGCWVFTHPDNYAEGEDAGRSYMTDLLQGRCECMDSKTHPEIPCKHECAAEPLYEAQMGTPYVRAEPETNPVDEDYIKRQRSLSEMMKKNSENPYGD